MGGGGMSLCHYCHTSACIGCEICAGSCKTKPAEANTHDNKLELASICSKEFKLCLQSDAKKAFHFMVFQTMLQVS